MRPAALALVALAIVGGCIRADEAVRVEATGASPVVFQGYDYAALTGQPAEGDIVVSLDPVSNTGTTVATVTLADRSFRAEFTRFAEARPFHEGGVRANFQEHGASGNGDALLPEFPALVAAWGQGRLSLDGQPFADPLTGSDLFAMHVMVADAAPREPSSLRALKADGSTPYDPATPQDARIHPGTRQILLNVQGLGGPAPPDFNTTFGDTVTEPQYARAHTFEVNTTAAWVYVNLTIANEAAPQAQLPVLGDLRFVLRDPGGNETGRYEYTPAAGAPGQPAAATFVLPAPLPSSGTYTLDVSGSGAGATYTATVLVDYLDPLFLHIVYTDVRVTGR